MFGGNTCVNPACLKDLAIRIRKGELTMAEAAKNHLIFDTIFGKMQIPKSESTLKRYFNDQKIRVFEIGRKGTTKDIEHIKDDVISVYLDVEVGITKTWMILKKKGVECSRFSVEKVFKKYIYPPVQQPKPKKEKIRYRYIVDKVNAVWHGDIHYLIRMGSQKYLFALIDDRSRYIVGYGIFNDKTASRVKSVMIEAIEKCNAKPLIYWSDNGLENTAKENKVFYAEQKIEHITTLPGNPQSNGKIEKFWSSMDKRVSKFQDWESLIPNIDKYINDYNTKIPHSGLEKGEDKCYKCPIEVFTDKSLIATDIYSTNIKIDQKGIIPLSEFIKCRRKEEKKLQSSSTFDFQLNSFLN